MYWYSKTSVCLWQYYTDERSNPITAVKSFTFKSGLLNNTNNIGTVNVEIPVPLKYLSNFWKDFEMTFVSCEINLILTLSVSFLKGIDKQLF